MTLEKELERAIEDRDILEMDSEAINDNIRHLEMRGAIEGNDEYDEEIRELNNLDNEILYLDSVIADLEWQIEERDNNA